jgi:hypothetical protein
MPDGDPVVPPEQPGAVQFRVEPTKQDERPRAWERLWRASSSTSRVLTTRHKVWRFVGIVSTLALLTALLGGQVATFTARLWRVAFPPVQGASPTCLADAAWSPSGNHLAILGYADSCAQGGHFAPVLNVYDGVGRLRLRQIPLDPLLSPATKTLARAMNTDRIALQNVIWLRGDISLAVTFTLPPRSDFGKTTTQFGILVFNPNSAHPAATTRFYEVPNRPGSSYPDARISIMWDLHTDRASMVSGADTFNAWDNPLSLAYQYAWTSSDDLVPASATNASTGAPPIGNPQVGAPFSVWQSGWLGSGIADVPVTPPDEWLAMWNTTFAAVSPDGLHLLTPLVMKAPVSPRLAGPFPRTPTDDGTPPILLARDAAFAQILRVWDRHANRAAEPIVYVAWRPDGKAVATFNLNDDQKIDIFDCATGRLLASRAEPRQSIQFNGVLEALRWSPDGNRLLTLDGAVLVI